jgi:cysteine sulfinate desulfinase/cysteine desulfurase-like protein
MVELKGEIAVSKGESDAVIEAAKLQEKLGRKIHWIEICKNGQVDLQTLQSLRCDYIFLSSYTIDTFVHTPLAAVKKVCDAKIISNATAAYESVSDAIYLNPYSLTGFNSSGVLLFNDDFTLSSIGYTDTFALFSIFEAYENKVPNTQVKSQLLTMLQERFDSDMYNFVDPNKTLEYTLHFGLKGLKARELIRTLALRDIFITNGEGCSLGLARPSKTLEYMGYTKTQCSNAVSLSFMQQYDQTQLQRFVEAMHLHYKQCIAL